MRTVNEMYILLKIRTGNEHSLLPAFICVAIAKYHILVYVNINAYYSSMT